MSVFYIVEGMEKELGSAYCSFKHCFGEKNLLIGNTKYAFGWISILKQIKISCLFIVSR